MRELKYRAWDNDNNKMIYPMERQAIIICCGVVEILTNFPVFGGTYTTKISYSCNGVLMQYTGLKDKNYREIYEGDIIRNNNVVKTSYLVKWNNAKSRYDAVYIPKENCLHNIIGGRDFADYVITGNKYNNPELLEGK